MSQVYKAFLNSPFSHNRGDEVSAAIPGDASRRESPHITGSKKLSEERAALFAAGDVIVSQQLH
jgi:hypothetical protein